MAAPNKLTGYDVAEIQRLRGSLSYTQLGKRFGVHRSTIVDAFHRPPPQLAPVEVPAMTTDEAVQLYRLEKQRAAERHAPAKARKQLEIEAAWEKAKQDQIDAQRGGRPRLHKVVVGKGR